MNKPIALELNGWRYTAIQLAVGTWEWQRYPLTGRNTALGNHAGLLDRQQPEQALKELIGIALTQCSLY